MKYEIGIKGKNFYSLIKKWIRIYGVKYVYWVLMYVRDVHRKTQKPISVGYIIVLLRTMYKEFDPSKIDVVIPTRMELLMSGYTIDMLPDYMLTKEEKNIIANNHVRVSKTDVENMKSDLGIN